MLSDTKIILYASVILLLSMFSYNFIDLGQDNLITGNQVSQQTKNNCQNSCTYTEFEKRCTSRSWYRRTTRCYNIPIKKVNEKCYSDCSNKSNTQEEIKPKTLQKVEPKESKIRIEESLLISRKEKLLKLIETNPDEALKFEELSSEI